MRGFWACLTASQQRSMSGNCARASPQITAFFDRSAISLTARKSPSEAMGNPASMISTPISSSSSAISSFSSWVMVAPGDCSPSRKVVSKMTTRFLSLVIGLVLRSRVWVLGAHRCRPYWAHPSVQSATLVLLLQRAVGEQRLSERSPTRRGRT